MVCLPRYEYFLSGVWSILLLGFFIACERVPEESREMQFRVNQDLLGDSIHVTQASLSFSPPKSFMKVSRDSNEISPFGTVPFVSSFRNYEIFVDSAFKAEMWTVLPDKGSEQKFLAQLRKSFQDWSAQDTIWQAAMMDSFPYNGFQVEQLFLQNEEVVSFCLLFTQVQENRSQPLFCVYAVPRASYTPLIGQSIESSIGSFTPL